MTFAEIRHALETAPRVPEAALRDAAAHVAELTPLVVELIEKLKAGIYLLPGQAQLLFYGLHVLAAARAAALWPAWCDLLRLPAEQPVDLFGDDVVEVFVGVTASLVGDDAPAVAALLEAPDVSEDVRWALFPVLARLAWEGRADLAETGAFLARFARDEQVPPDDMGWHGWVDAVVLLGLVDLTPLLEEVLAKRTFEGFNPADRRNTLKRLAEAADDFADEGRFLRSHVAPFDDPVEALWWLRAQQAHEDEWLAQHPGDAADDEPPDPAADIALTEREEDWLRGFLASRQTPATTLSFEALDGFFCALVVGPEAVPPSEYMPYVWGGYEPGEGPVYESKAQQRFVLDLFTRLWNAIARRIADGVGHEPFLFPANDDADVAEDWASAFLLGATLRDAAWEPLTRHRKSAPLLASILSLCPGDPESPGDAIAPDQRAEIVDDLPDLLLAIAAFWRRAGQPPVRSQKVGRNEPCPCGSGRKYKKCCGAAA